jgi:hypothetical protein
VMNLGTGLTRSGWGTLFLGLDLGWENGRVAHGEREQARVALGLAGKREKKWVGAGLASRPCETIGKERKEKGHGPALRIQPKGLLGIEIPFFFSWFIFKIKSNLNSNNF